MERKVLPSKVLPLTNEEKLEYCNMHFDCLECSGGYEKCCCPMVSKELTDERIEEIRIELIKGKEIK